MVTVETIAMGAAARSEVRAVEESTAKASTAMGSTAVPIMAAQVRPGLRPTLRMAHKRLLGSAAMVSIEKGQVL